MLWFDHPKQWKYTLLASAVAIACWGMPLSLTAFAADLNRQLAIPLNNGTLHPQRREADRLMQLGGQQRQNGTLTKAIDAWQSALAILQRGANRQPGVSGRRKVGTVPGICSRRARCVAARSMRGIERSNPWV